MFLLFDELDYGLSTARRPVAVKLPALDRLQAESFSATHAFPPANLTNRSMPGMLTGRLVADATALADDDWRLKFDDGTAGLLSREGNIVRDLNNAGVTTLRLGGIYGPGILGGPWRDKMLSSCPSMPQRVQASLLDSMAAQWNLAESVLPFRNTLFREKNLPQSREEQAAALICFSRTASTVAARADSNFIYIHFNLPHEPYLYNQVAGTFSPTGEATYIDNLVGVDHVLAQIRAAMEEAGSWQGTTIIVTSDHWYRYGVLRGDTPSDHRVPFLVKFAGSHTPLSYAPGFNTVLFRAMAGAIAKGELGTVGTLAKWLDAHRSIGESPLTRDLK